ncbi:glycosyl hydrolase [Parabacteroides sp. TM07-1AC]|uniref:glycoside hydrolase family 3 N-terminal domain-containing protein n=1 Tax=Parabacteroides sp. TM07-1AC TaxID=2292363 RepID=UPI000EFFD179|nr:glycoside hydrolase family 3 N-terminal domain-containing protein [Parabacteroides sp. TM07-1AC]RHU29233.1 glycosyl hydrolase [Parabacteroides sp. TM07-1AC]
MKRKTMLLCLSLSCSLGIHSLAATSDFPYKNPKLSVEQRVSDLLGRMTLEEKVGQLNMKSLNRLKIDKKGKVTVGSLDSLFNGESIGCLESPFIEHEKIAVYSEAADQYLRTKTRLGIPAIQIAECLHGHMALGATIFPQSIGLGSTWNPELIQEMAGVIAEEALLAGVDQALSPLFDIARDPRYGRVEECYGEDPYLVKEMGVAFVKGLQGEPVQSAKGIAPGKLAAMGKHFVAYSKPEAGINIAPALVGERELREDHLYPFEAAVKEANIYSIMPGYHEIDGVPIHASKWLLKDVLRDEWGFKGYIFSDYGAIGMMNYLHHTADGPKETGFQAITAGVDVEAPSAYGYKHLVELVKEGRLPESVIDERVRCVLTMKFKMGLFDRPFKVHKNDQQKVHTKENVDLARRIAEESIVLLQNNDNILPLDKSKLKSLAVIGPNADKVQFGDYSPTKNNDYGVTVLQGLREYLGDEVKVNYALGCGITSLFTDSIASAVEIAKNSDAVVLVLGGTSQTLSGIGWGDENSKELATCGEGYDRNELDFPGVQPQLLEAVAATGKPIVLVMINGRPLTIGEEAKKVNAVVEAWYPGERGGEAVARILFGEVNPSGRLSMTFPPTTGHIPMYAAQKPSARGFYKSPGTPENPGRDYVFAHPKPLFCFGHGMSYTTFEYKNMHIKEADDVVKVTCELANTGKRDGAEVTQLYIRDMVSSTSTSLKALKAFKKVYLKAGETKTIELVVKKEDLKVWNPEMKKVLEPGEFKVMIGSSVEDIRLDGSFEVM